MSDLDDAVTALENEDFHTRRTAIEKLKQLADPRSLPALVRALSSDSDEYVRIDAAISLGLIGDERATPALLIALKSEGLLTTWREQWDKLGPFADRKFLWQYLTAEISDIRYYSAISLGQLGDPAAVNGLIEALNDKDDPNVRQAAAQALRVIGTPEALAAVAGTAGE